MRTLTAEPCRCVWCQRPIALCEEAESRTEGEYHLDCYVEAERCELAGEDRRVA